MNRVGCHAAAAIFVTVAAAAAVAVSVAYLDVALHLLLSPQ